MLSEAQLSNFTRYLARTPKHLRGPVGAYDAILGASAHGFGIAHHPRHARDEAPRRASELLLKLAETLSSEEWAKLGALLRGDDGEARDDLDPRGMDSKLGALARGSRSMPRDFAEAFPAAMKIGFV